jgi:succinate dehydrogenase/fumarate reductase cytochrome b subunit
MFSSFAHAGSPRGVGGKGMHNSPSHPAGRSRETVLVLASLAAEPWTAPRFELSRKPRTTPMDWLSDDVYACLVLPLVFHFGLPILVFFLVSSLNSFPVRKRCWRWTLSQTQALIGLGCVVHIPTV